MDFVHALTGAAHLSIPVQPSVEVARASSMLVNSPPNTNTLALLCAGPSCHTRQAQCRAHTWKFIGGNAHADVVQTSKPVHHALRNLIRHQRGVIRVVHRRPSNIEVFRLTPRASDSSNAVPFQIRRDHNLLLFSF